MSKTTCGATVLCLPNRDSGRPVLSGIPGIVADSVGLVRFRPFPGRLGLSLKPRLGDAFPPVGLNQGTDPQPEEEQHPE